MGFLLRIMASGRLEGIFPLHGTFHIVKGQKGITIAQIILVLGIFCFFTLAAIPMYLSYVGQNRREQAEREMKLVAQALQQLNEDTQAYPAQSTGGDPGVVANNGNLASWQGPYLKQWPKGPRGWTPQGGQGAYQLRNFYFEGLHTVALWSYGPNLIPETDLAAGKKSQGDDLVIYLMRTK